MLRTPSWERVDEGRLRSPHAIAIRSWLGCDLDIKLNQSPQVSHTSELSGTRDSSFGNECAVPLPSDFSPCCREGFPSQEAGKLAMVNEQRLFSFTLLCNLSQLSSCCVRISCPFSRDGWITSA